MYLFWSQLPVRRLWCGLEGETEDITDGVGMNFAKEGRRRGPLCIKARFCLGLAFPVWVNEVQVWNRDCQPVCYHVVGFFQDTLGACFIVRMVSSKIFLIYIFMLGQFCLIYRSIEGIQEINQYDILECSSLRIIKYVIGKCDNLLDWL